MDGTQIHPDTDSGPELASPDTHLGTTESGATISSERTEAATKLEEVIDAGVEQTTITNMTEPLGKGVHGHGPTKAFREGTHDVRAAFNVNPEIITSDFEAGVLPNGHEAVAYLLANKERLIDSDTELFLDVRDASESRWAHIEKVRQRAPISPQRESEIYADAHAR